MSIVTKAPYDVYWLERITWWKKNCTVLLRNNITVCLHLVWFSLVSILCLCCICFASVLHPICVFPQSVGMLKTQPMLRLVICSCMALSDSNAAVKLHSDNYEQQWYSILKSSNIQSIWITLSKHSKTIVYFIYKIICNANDTTLKHKLQ